MRATATSGNTDKETFTSRQGYTCRCNVPSGRRAKGSIRWRNLNGARFRHNSQGALFQKRAMATWTG